LRQFEMLTVRQVARRLNVDPGIVRRKFIATGLLRAHRLGPRLTRILVSEVDRFIAEQRLECPGHARED
jgi:excisionase family DNA binding protein